MLAVNHSEEAKHRMRHAWQRRSLTFVPPMKGKQMSEESRRKMSESAKKRGSNRTGAQHTFETRARIREVTRERTARGEHHYAYTHGKAQRAFDDRRRPEYQEWRNAVFLRDNFTCQKCGSDKGGYLRAHHVLHFSKHPTLRYDVANGVTLFHRCHELEHFKPDSIRNLRKAKRGSTLY